MTRVYPEWLELEGWINKGTCDADLPNHEKFELMGKHGQNKVAWICVGQVSNDVICIRS